MTRPGPLPPAGRLAAVLGAPPHPADDAGDAPLGPDGVWPPPRPAVSRRSRIDPPTVPLPWPVGPGEHGREVGADGGLPGGVEQEEWDAGDPGADRRAGRGFGGVRAGGGGGDVAGRAFADARGGTGDPDVDLSAGAGRSLPAGRLAVLLGRMAPPAWRGARVDPGRPGATALALVAAAAAVLAAVGVWFERPRAEPVADLPAVTVVAEPTAAPDGPVPTAPAAAPATLVVSVSGKVQRPGLVEVPEGSRVADVLEAAGGALPGTDLSGLNLARRVGDGEQVAVGVPPAPDAAPASGAAPGPAAPGAPAGKIDLNSATLDQLDALPGVGPVTAQRILEWRTRNGRFTRIEQLREIEGIGERRFAQLRELVSV